ncbi:glycerate kinase [Desulfosporosinus orientis DSM 765]|uniref:Glycerate kinase n=1 Tax=Desulfosporosinus orientis (strain ATCC 19365 / DSM 765 / NCIMB 8382 / VKM B-1628 / Singapore I) TaxID=768706 RepID=G7WFT6_DESOD|nr:glycerate kinase [Desulfosporosinus orientis]AET68959.1 glycerate kinase [Desulfosporosinus orientis DSM 765]
MKIVIAPDSFKGCLNAFSVAQAMSRGVQQIYPSCEIDLIPMADGGEGTVEAILSAVPGEKVKVQVTDPLGRPIEAIYGLIEGGSTAIIEMAAASGLTLLSEAEKNPRLTSTYGTGLIIKDALERGVKKILLGIGGSATNDGGAGLAAALGVRLLDKHGKELSPGGAALRDLAEIDMSKINPRLSEVKIEVACDVQNPLCGPMGASAVYGPQKGANSEDIRYLDKALKNFGEQLSSIAGINLLELPGGGAAGGLGAGSVGFLGAQLRPGSEIVLEVANAEAKIKTADLVLTGEGRTDFQTAYGKVPVGVAALAKNHNVPVLVISGSVDGSPDALSSHGICTCFSVSEGPVTLEEAFVKAEQQLERAVWRILAVWKLGNESMLKANRT